MIDMSAAGRKNDDQGATSTCSWCSAAVPVEAARCPSCGAALRDLADGDVLGVTQVDIAATSRLSRMTRQPGRLATWLGAEATSDNPELAGRIEEPSDEVRKEMLRLKLLALDAEIEAKTAIARANQILESTGTTEPTDLTVAAEPTEPTEPTDAPKAPPG